MLIQKPPASIIYIKLFFIILFVSALLSLSYKGFLLIKNRGFRFETVNIVVVDRDAYLISLNRAEERLAIFKFANKGNIFMGKSIFGTSVILGVPIDGLITAKTSQSQAFAGIEKNFFRPELLYSLIFEDKKFNSTRINKLDFIQLFVVSRFISESRRKAEIINEISNNFRENSNMDLEIGDLFRDSKIFNEKASLEIVNSTEIDGLGSRIAFALKNLGYNVVAVSNGNHRKSQIITREKKMMSVERLERIFNLKSEKGDAAGIADIMLIIGSDMVKN